MTQVKIPTLKLNNGFDIPVLGYGAWLGLNENTQFRYEAVPKFRSALEYAIDAGYRHIDTAHLYRVEGVIGDIVQKKISQGKIKREDLFITTKVWNHMHAFEDVEKSLRDCLQRLKTQYVDLALVHWPVSVTVDGEDAKIDYLETWRGMEAAQEMGLARSIGVSNFNLEQLKRLLQNCKIRPAMNQVEVNLNLAQNELVGFCQKEGIAVTAYTPFGTMLPERNPVGSPEPKVDSPIMVELSKKYGKTPTQIALRHLYQRGICSIPKSLTSSRIVENASIFDFELSQEDFHRLATFDNGYRTVRPVCWQDMTYWPFDKIPLDKPVAIPEPLRNWRD